MSGEGHPPGCPDCTPCRICGEPAWCVSEHPVNIPCPHLDALCGECLLAPDGCVRCRVAAEAEMHASGKYDPAADPFIAGAPALHPLDVPAWLAAAERRAREAREAREAFALSPEAWRAKMRGESA